MATKVVIIAPTFEKPDSVWLDDFIETSAYRFQKVLRGRREKSWHERGAVTETSEWREFFFYARRAFAEKPDIVATNFPQLAFAAALVKALTFRKTLIIAWSFNLGSTANKLKGRIAGLFLRPVTRFIVHSSEERVRYAAWLGLPEDRFVFAALQRGAPGLKRQEETQAPYIVAMGSAGRDYETLAAATEDFPGKVVIVAKQQIADQLPKRANLDVRSGLSMAECDRLLVAARLNVVPIANLDTASGQVTFINSLAHGVATIATDCPGTRDYLIDGENALIVPPRDAAAMRGAIDALWSDAARREAIAAAGVKSWRDRFSDQSAAAAFKQILDRLTGREKGQDTAEKPLEIQAMSR